jgi:hypothetical protein
MVSSMVATGLLADHENHRCGESCPGRVLQLPANSETFDQVILGQEKTRWI